MNFHWPFFRKPEPVPDYVVIHVVDQPRDDAGRFVSQRTITTDRLKRLTASITDPAQREACKARGSVRPVSDKGRGRG